MKASVTTTGKVLAGTGIIGGVTTTPPAVLAVQRSNEIKSLNQKNSEWETKYTKLQSTKSNFEVDSYEGKTKEKKFKELLDFMADDKNWSQLEKWAKDNLEDIKNTSNCLMKEKNNCVGELAALGKKLPQTANTTKGN